MIFGCSHHCFGKILEDIVLSYANDFATSAERNNKKDKVIAGNMMSASLKGLVK
jgi:hypothetical protein